MLLRERIRAPLAGLRSIRSKLIGKIKILIKYRTRRFIGKELILAIGKFFNNSPILKSPNFISRYLDMPIIKGHTLIKHITVAESHHRYYIYTSRSKEKYKRST